MKNFEIGVLFHSSVARGGGVVYRTWPTPTGGGNEALSSSSPSSSSSSPPPVPAGFPPSTRTIPVPLPYRLDGAPYTTQDEWDPTPDLLLAPYFHSLHGLPDLARLRALMPQIEGVFAQVGRDLQELARVHGLDARGRKLLVPLHGNVLAAMDGNVEKRVLGRGEEGEEEGMKGEKRLKATVSVDGRKIQSSTM